MSCCRPEYRVVVKEQEELLNQKGRDSLPLLGKVLSFLITAGVIMMMLIK